MKFEKVSLKKSWKSPALQPLDHDDKRVREAMVKDPHFAAAAQRLSIKA